MKLSKSEKAEAEFVGNIIILGITILGVSMIALYGVPSILSLQDMANLKNAEQTFAVLDSHAGRAVLGDSQMQTISINLGGGTMTVEPNSTNSPSYIVVNGTIFNFTIPMGKVKYELGDRTVAYEGGGVWSKYPSGSVMLSRPEFDYNGVTLTLPVFDINGSTSVGGKGTAIVSFKKNQSVAPVVLFPTINLSRMTAPPVPYKWTFDIDSEGWFYGPHGGYTWEGAGCVPFSGNPVPCGNPAGSIYFSVSKSGNDLETITWTSPNFSWTYGIPVSANFSLDWVPVCSAKGVTISYQVKLYKPDGTYSPIYSTAFSCPPGSYSGYWSPGWSSIPPQDITNQFDQRGNNYYLTIDSQLRKSSGRPEDPTEYVEYDNPTITIVPGVDRSKLNPVNFSIGKVYVNITSDFYDAWADYIRSVSSVKIVSEDKTNRTTSVALTVLPAYAGVSDSPIFNPIVFRGIDSSNPTSLNHFSFKIYISGMNKWDIRAGSGTQGLIFYIDQSNALSIAYQNSSILGKGETWGTYPYTVKTDAGGDYIDVDLLDNSVNLNYSNLNNVGADSANACQQFAGEISGSHDPAYSWNNLYINTTNANSTQSLYTITQHYIQQMAQLGDITFGECVPSGKKLPDPDSTMYIDYAAPGGLTYLHVTDNKADVGIS